MLGAITKRVCCAICLAATTLLASQSAQARDNTSASFGKWRTFCDKALLCVAYTYSGVPGNPNDGHVFSLERPQGGDGWRMSLTLDGVEPNLSLGLHASVIRMGHDEELIPHFEPVALHLGGGQFQHLNTGVYELYLTGPSAEMIMEGLRPADILDFQFGGCSNEFEFANFLLDGVTAALAWIDVQQSAPMGSTDISDPVAGSLADRSKNCSG